MEGRPVGESVERLIKFIIFGPVGQLDVLVASCYFDTLTNFLSMIYNNSAIG